MHASPLNQPSIQPQLADRQVMRERPAGLPLMRQHWSKLLFMHWPLPADLIRPLLPRRLAVDTFDGQAWIAITPFTVRGLRASFLPPVPGTSTFHELNVRTYVHLDGAPGVWFFSLDAANTAAVIGARLSYHLPYMRAEMLQHQEGNTIRYTSRRTQQDAPPAIFNATWQVGEHLPPAEPGSLAFFLTERYALYAAQGEKLFQARIFHEQWPLQTAAIGEWQSSMISAAGLPEPASPPLLHYSEHVEVDIWPIRRV